jgi:protein-export membrane protein SecD
MLQFTNWQKGLIALLVAAAAYFTVPNFFDSENPVPGFANTKVTLGLDLQGGSYLLMKVDTDKVIEDRIENVRKDVRLALRGRGGSGGDRITFFPPTKRDDTVTVQIRKAEEADEAQRRLEGLIAPVGGIGSIYRNLEVEKVAGTTDTFALTMTEEAKRIYADQAVADSIEAVRRRVDGLGTTEPSIVRQGADRIVLQLPGDEDSERLKDIINAEGQLSFHMVDSAISPQEAAVSLPASRMLLPSRDGFDLVVERDPEVTGDMVTSASASPNPDGGNFQVNISFDKRGQLRFYEATKGSRGRLFAIVLDNEIISAPRINEPINAPSFRIIGDFTPQEASDLSLLIRAGALPAPLEVLDQRTVSASLGKEAVRAGTLALIIGFVAVVVYMVLSYGRFGVYADIALIANVLLMAGALSLLGATLTLPGIAGIVLTIGMAVDANVLIFERIREEIRNGKPPVMAVQTGYQKAFSAIVDANVTTFLAAAIMFYLGSGPVRGFSVTLAIGVMTSVFTAYVLTRMFAGGYVLGKRPKTITL